MKRLYVKNDPSIKSVEPCTHNIDINSKYYLEASYAKKYNNCLLCAIDAWNGPMPHDEVALCLGMTRMRVCQIEQKLLDKLKKRLASSCRTVDDCLIEIKGNANKIEKSIFKKLCHKIGQDFDLQLPVKISFTKNDISLDDKPGGALYEFDGKAHNIIIDMKHNSSSKELIKTTTHEIFHAVQIENNKLLDDKMSEAVADMYLKKYYSLFIRENRKLKKLRGKKK